MHEPPPAADLLTNPSSPEAAALAVAWVIWVLANLFLIPAAGSRLLLRGVEPGWYPLWGFTYLRFWLHGRVAGLAPVGLLTGTPLLPPYLRLLGAKVGPGCYVSGRVGLPPLVQIGADVSVGYGAKVQPYVVQDGWLRLAPIEIGSGCFLGTNSVVLAGAHVGDHASVGEQSLVHADHHIPDGEHWAGSPIKRLPAAPALLETMAGRAGDRRWRAPVIVGFLGAMLLLTVLPVLTAAPSVALVGYVTVRWGLAAGLASLWLAAPLFVLVTCVALAVTKRAVLWRARPGIYLWRSGFGVREWLSNHLMAMSVATTRTLYCTLYVVPFLRLLGVRMGRWCEIATPSLIDPDMTIMGDQCFLAGGVVTAPPVYHRGCLAVAPAEMGNRSFVGNVALLPASSRMGDNSLLGVLSVAPTRPIDPETTWLGSPPMFLPRRQVSERFPDTLTYAPTPGLIAGRLVIEFFRVSLPGTILGTNALVGLYASVELAAHLSPLELLVALPVLGLGLAGAAIVLVALLKWLIIGRYRPRTEPYWGIWVRRTELVTGLFETVVEPTLTGTLSGTPWMAPFLRLFGARIGSRVWLASTGGTEFDLVEIGDDAAVGEDTSVQTHLFEDRVMKMSWTKVAAGSSVGSGSVVLYDAVVGPGARLDSLSLVMKGETLPAGTGWRGIPARACRGATDRQGPGSAMEPAAMSGGQA